MQPSVAWYRNRTVHAISLALDSCVCVCVAKMFGSLTVSAIYIALWFLSILCVPFVALFSWFDKLNDDYELMMMKSTTFLYCLSESQKMTETIRPLLNSKLFCFIGGTCANKKIPYKKYISVKVAWICECWYTSVVFWDTVYKLTDRYTDKLILCKPIEKNNVDIHYAFNKPVGNMMWYKAEFLQQLSTGCANKKPLGKIHYLSYCERFFHQIYSFLREGFAPHTQQISLQYLL